MAESTRLNFVLYPSIYLLFFLPSVSATAEVPITLLPSVYVGKVNNQLMVNISAFVTVKETDYHYVGKETFRFPVDRSQDCSG